MGVKPSRTSTIFGTKSASAAVHVRDQFEHWRVVFLLYARLLCWLCTCLKCCEYKQLTSLHRLNLLRCTQTRNSMLSYSMNSPAPISQRPQWTVTRLDMIMGMLGDRAKNSVLSGLPKILSLPNSNRPFNSGCFSLGM